MTEITCSVCGSRAADVDPDLELDPYIDRKYALGALADWVSVQWFCKNGHQQSHRWTRPHYSVKECIVAWLDDCSGKQSRDEMLAEAEADARKYLRVLEAGFSILEARRLASDLESVKLHYAQKDKGLRATLSRLVPRIVEDAAPESAKGDE